MKKSLAYKNLVKFILAITLMLSLVACTNMQSKYTSFQESYFNISQKATDNVSMNKDDLEDLMGAKVTDFIKGDSKEDEFNSYKFNLNDEEVLVYTNSNSNKITFVKYEKAGEIILVNSLEKDSDIGGYKYGFTSRFMSPNLNNQKDLFNNQLSK